MPGNEGYINVVAAMQKYFDQAISGNWSYNPLHYDNNEVPMSVLTKDFLTTYKLGWKTSYYQNTYDFKGEEPNITDNENTMTIDEAVNGPIERADFQGTDKEYEEYCDSCAI